MAEILGTGGNDNLNDWAGADTIDGCGNDIVSSCKGSGKDDRFSGVANSATQCLMAGQSVLLAADRGRAQCAAQSGRTEATGLHARRSLYRRRAIDTLTVPRQTLHLVCHGGIEEH